MGGGIIITVIFVIQQFFPHFVHLDFQSRQVPQMVDAAGQSKFFVELRQTVAPGLHPSDVPDRIFGIVFMGNVGRNKKTVAGRNFIFFSVQNQNAIPFGVVEKLVVFVAHRFYGFWLQLMLTDAVQKIRQVTDSGSVRIHIIPHKGLLWNEEEYGSHKCSICSIKIIPFLVLLYNS